MQTIMPEPLSWMPDYLVEPLKKASFALKKANTILIVGHESPDGDALGSTLALTSVLRAMGKTVIAFNVDPVPSKFEFLPLSETITSTLSLSEPIDLTVVVDSSERHRLGEYFPEKGFGKTVLCIDHHKTKGSSFYDIFIHDVHACAAGVLIYRLIVELGEPLTPDAATSLFCAIQTDTGSFRYESTSAHSMEVATQLLKTGINVWEISSEIYESFLPERMHLLSQVLSTLQVSSSGQIASIYVDQKMIDSSDAQWFMTGDFINYARSIRGVEVAFLLRDDQSGKIRVSLRSKGKIDVSKVTEQFGGGGHKNAAGCKIKGTLLVVRKKIEKIMQSLVEKK